MKIFSSIILSLGILNFFPLCKSPNNNHLFPLNTGNKWTYKRSLYQSKINKTDPDKLFNESKLEIEIPDTIVLNKTSYFIYKIIGSNSREKIIRYENGNYFMNDSIRADELDSEIVFLKENLSQGDKWEKVAKTGDFKLVFTVNSIKKEMTFMGNKYYNTIEIYRQYMSFSEGKWSPGQKTKHIYAPGIGEIYSYIPYPMNGTYADEELILENFYPAK